MKTTTITDGTNESTPANIKDAVDKKHSPNTDTILTTDGSTQLLNAGTLKTNLLVDDGINIQIDEVRAKDGDGLKLYDDGGNGIFVEDGGNVGIGTAGPVSDLEIKGTTGLALTHPDYSGGDNPWKIFAASNGDLAIDFTGATGDRKVVNLSNSHLLEIYDTSVNKKVQLNTNGDSYFTGGNVGIGTTSPGEKLEVDGNIDASGVLKIDGTQVVKEQQAAVANATDLTIVDQFNLLLNRLRAHGLIAS